MPLALCSRHPMQLPQQPPPPSRLNSSNDVYVSLAHGAEAPHSTGLQFTYFEPEAPPIVLDASPKYGDWQAHAPLATFRSAMHTLTVPPNGRRVAPSR